MIYQSKVLSFHLQCVRQRVQSSRSVSVELTEGDGPRRLYRTERKHLQFFNYFSSFGAVKSNVCKENAIFLFACG